MQSQVPIESVEERLARLEIPVKFEYCRPASERIPYIEAFSVSSDDVTATATATATQDTNGNNNTITDPTTATATTTAFKKKSKSAEKKVRTVSFLDSLRPLLSHTQPYTGPSCCTQNWHVHAIRSRQMQ